MTKQRYAYRLGWRSLKRVAPSLTTGQAKSLARDLAVAMLVFDIRTRRRAAMFIAQVCHESLEFRYREEIASGHEYDITVNPRLAKDLGNTHPGDGERFKGRTYIQITGRTNYAEISRALDVDFIASPQLLAQPAYAAKGAAWWWHQNDCNQIADTGDFVAVTKRINGGTNGLANREMYYRRARLVAPFLIPKRRKP